MSGQAYLGLHYHIERGNVPEVRYLLKQHDYPKSVLYAGVRCAVLSDQLEIVKIFVEDYGQTVEDLNPFFVKEALDKGRLELLNYLVDKGAPVSELNYDGFFLRRRYEK